MLGLRVGLLACLIMSFDCTVDNDVIKTLTLVNVVGYLVSYGNMFI